MNKLFISIISFLVLSSTTAFCQTEAVRWITFEQLADSLTVNPKRVFIYFYADWCAPCLRMQREVFTDKKVIEMMNADYYAVQMNVESKDTIRFGEQVFINERINRRNPVHQIPLLMASQKNKPFSLPALVFFDEGFKAKARYLQYLNTEQFLEILEKNSAL